MQTLVILCHVRNYNWCQKTVQFNQTAFELITGAYETQ